MNQSKMISSNDLSKDSNDKRFNILNPRDYEDSMKELSKNQNLFDLMRKGFQLKYDITRGLQFNELEELIQLEQEEEDIQLMLKQVQHLSEGQSTWLATTSIDPMKRESILIFGQMINGKYDLLNVRATQIQKLDEQKIIACGLGALCAVILVSSIATPIAGVIAGGSILAASGVKAVCDYRKVLPNLIYGYIFQELTNKDVINVHNDHYKI